jgi:hypothetical protein
MRRLIVFLLCCILLHSAAAGAAPPNPLQECKIRYATTQRVLWLGSTTLPAAKQDWVAAVLASVRSSLTLLNEQGSRAYPQLCSADVLEALDRVSARVKEMQPPPLASVEAEAERNAS